MNSWVLTGEEIFSEVSSFGDPLSMEITQTKERLFDSGSNTSFSQGRFLLLHWPDELIFLMIDLDCSPLNARQQYLMCVAGEQLAIVSTDDIEGNYKRIFVDSHGVVMSRCLESGEMVPFVAPFNRFSQSPGSANMLIKYFDAFWIEVRGEIRKALAKIGMHLLVHQQSESRSVFVLCTSRTILE